MRSINIIILISYFALLCVASVFFYMRVYPGVIDPTTPSQRVISNQDTPSIYFESGNNLYRTLPDVSLDRLGAPRTEIIAQSVSTSGLITSNSSVYFDNLINPTQSVLIAQSLADNSHQVLFSSTTPGLENYSSFSRLKSIPDGNEILFLASNAQTSNVFRFNLRSNHLENISAKANLNSLYDFSLSPDGRNIVLMGKINDKYVIIMIDLKTKKSTRIKDSDQKMTGINWVSTGLFFMINDEPGNLNTFNLYSLDTSSQQQKTISRVASPSSVDSFSVSGNGKFIVFDVLKDQGSDLFMVQNDGTNLVQITKDSQSFYPLFLPESPQIVFWRANQGLFKVNIDMNNFSTIKFLDFKDKINKIYTWR